MPGLTKENIMGLFGDDLMNFADYCINSEDSDAPKIKFLFENLGHVINHHDTVFQDMLLLLKMKGVITQATIDRINAA